MPSSNILSPALKSILVNRLQKALDCFIDTWLSIEPVSHSTLQFQNRGTEQSFFVPKISLKRAQTATQIWYVSAIAFKLTPVIQRPSIEIANQIAQLAQDSSTQLDLSTISTQSEAQAVQIAQQIKIETAPPGWLYLRLDDNLVPWLQWLTDYLPMWMSQCSNSSLNRQSLCPPSGKATTLPHFPAFKIQHAHARSYSLLQLGEPNLIRLNSASRGQPFPQQIVEPHPIPWQRLWTHRGLDAVKTQNIIEWQLILQIIDTLDALTTLDSWNQIAVQNHALRNSQLFQSFHATCQIYGEVAAETPDLAQARLGLSGLTQSLLCWLLQQLGNKAPTEL